MRRSHYLLVAILVVGGGLGLLSMVGESSQRALTILVNLAAPWALGAFLVGRLAPSPKLGALAGGATLVVGMATFSATGLTTSTPSLRLARPGVERPTQRALYCANALFGGPMATLEEAR